MSRYPSNICRTKIYITLVVLKNISKSAKNAKHIAREVEHELIEEQRKNQILTNNDDRVIKDTIKIQFIDSSKIETFRLIWVDTPETKHPNKEVEKYWIDAYEFVLKELKWKEIVTS